MLIGDRQHGAVTTGGGWRVGLQCYRLTAASALLQGPSHTLYSYSDISMATTCHGQAASATVTLLTGLWHVACVMITVNDICFSFTYAILND